MRLSLEALQALDAIASQGSFARAAETLHKVPSALTYTMQKLESDLDVLLFDRSGQRAVLTPIGRELLEQGRELLRQAEGIEQRIRRLNEGWKTTLTIALDNVVPMRWMHPHIAAFDALNTGTRLKFTQEVFGGTYDALLDHRADLAVGAPGEPPAGLGLMAREWLQMPAFVFAVAPHHPLAQAAEPIPARSLAKHRAIVVADSSRRLEGRTAGLQPAQDTLHVATLEHKIAAQVAGLGIGFVPVHLAADALQSGALVIKQVEQSRERLCLMLAWRGDEQGLALSWWRDRLLQQRPGEGD